MTNEMNDDRLIELAEAEYVEDRLLAAARLLQKIHDKGTKLTKKHIDWISKAATVAKVIDELTSKPGKEWKKQGESHGDYDTIIYYKVVESQLTARIETPIEQSLLVPLISVFNESELYATWLPSWEKPTKLGVQKSVKLRQTGRCSQLILATTEMPWPLAKREVVIDVVAVDDIDANEAIVVKMQNPSCDDPDDPPVEDGAVRIDYDGGLLFRKCPEHHVAFKKSKHHPDGDMILVCMTIHVDAKLSYVPQTLINFVTRTVLGRMWTSLLRVAQDVRDGKRPQHIDAIMAKRESLYDWVEERVKVMLLTINSREPVGIPTTAAGVDDNELGAVLGFL
jgi:hypothetical protein